jgi:hypothetical protein
MWRGQSGLLKTEQTPIRKIVMAEEGGKDDRGDRGLDEELKADAESQ